ncbi:MAG: hypothetical protein R3E66_09485 [bacterium]
MKYLILALAFVIGCSDDTANSKSNNGTPNNGTTNNVSNNGTTSNNGADGGVNDTDLPDLPFTVNDAGQVLCGDTPCACSDGIDNDGDGQVDGFDLECTGPYDNDEDSFATGIPGDNKDPFWQDCFFDGNSGSGNDGCRYRTECLTGELPQSDPDCQLSQRCIDFCAPYTPNGCDCFGCCEVYPQGANTPIFVQIGNTCSDEQFDDLNACPRCVQSTQCGNTCRECELCGGKTVADLPASCSTGGDPDMGGGVDMGGSDMGGGGDPGYTCDNGQQVCSATTPCARNDQYCSQGCCIQILL